VFDHGHLLADLDVIRVVIGAMEEGG